jgi:hypothetical protein
VNIKCTGLILASNKLIYYSNAGIDNKMTQRLVCFGFTLCHHMCHLVCDLWVFHFHYYDLRNTPERENMCGRM